MRRNITLLLMLICLIVVGVSVTAQTPASAPQKQASQITRGAALGGSPAVPLAKLLDTPKQYLDKPVIVEGVVKRVCQRKGCWMELAASEASAGVRVTFKDYGFFVPTDSKGMKVKAEGQLKLEVLSKADADHLAGEGAQFKRNPDGTVDELSFVATGVELHQ